MAKNRALLYGYQIESGKFITNDAEAEAIHRIYHSYSEGLSYKAIADSLTEDGIRYMPEKPTWNKNMVARILQNQNYLGMGKYPQIIEETLCLSVKLAQKPYTHTESKEIKDIKPLLVCAECGKPIRRRIKTSGEERWYCEENFKHISVMVTDKALLLSIESLWYHLLDNLQLADSEGDNGEDNPISLETIRLKNEIDQMLKAEKVDESRIQSKILAFTALRYDFYDTPQYNNRELMQRLLQAPQEFSATLILETISKIMVSYREAEALVLKNEKVIEKGGDRYGHGES